MNSVNRISKDRVEKLRKEISANKDIYFVELNGEELRSWYDFEIEMEKRFMFPTTCLDSIDRYLDWMTDLSWLESEHEHAGYVIIIDDYDTLLDFEEPMLPNNQENPKTKEKIMAYFERIILPFWEEEVERVVVGGKAKSFNVYLVD